MYTFIHRVLQWPRSASVLDLPNELIFEEILSHLANESLTSLEGMQTAFTCKEFYRKLRPVLTGFYVDRLVEAYAKGKLVTGGTLDLASFTRKIETAFKEPPSGYSAQPSSLLEYPDMFTSLEISYSVHFGIFSDSDALWGLSSLLSMPRVAKYLCSFHLNLKSDRLEEHGEKDSVVPSAEWRRAFAVLLARVSAAPEGVEMHLWGTIGQDLLEGTMPEASLGHPATFPSSFRSQSRLRELTLRESIVNILWPSQINALLHHSSHTLTDLCLVHGEALPGK